MYFDTDIRMPQSIGCELRESDSLITNLKARGKKGQEKRRARLASFENSYLATLQDIFVAGHFPQKRPN